MASADPGNSIHPQTRVKWRAWLAKHHGRAEGVWLILWKKASGKAEMSYDELVQEALCFGWVDSKPAKLDEMRSMLWLAPRKAGTGWSRPNKLRVENAIKTGRMAAPGLAKVEAAKLDGSWIALDAVEALELPADLLAAFASVPTSQGNFEVFPRSVKRGILEWISTAKTETTRARRIAETASRAALNERANQWRK
jgi:uncharacterized protein YdeI (YjbR/CyaY-like superfamily)